jgi:hypothetical protein
MLTHPAVGARAQVDRQAQYSGRKETVLPSLTPGGTVVGKE